VPEEGAKMVLVGGGWGRNKLQGAVAPYFLRLCIVVQVLRPKGAHRR